jgi:hypothetical protein
MWGSSPGGPPYGIREEYLFRVALEMYADLRKRLDGPSSSPKRRFGTAGADLTIRAVSCWPSNTAAFERGPDPVAVDRLTGEHLSRHLDTPALETPPKANQSHTGADHHGQPSRIIWYPLSHRTTV